MIDIGTIKGYKIKYDTGRKLFLLFDADGNEVASGFVQEEVEDKAKKLAKKSFVPFEAMKPVYESQVRYGRVTSVNMDEQSVMFVYTDTPHRHAHEKIRFQHSELYLRTDHNEQIMAQIAAVQATINEQRAQIKDLQGELENRIGLEFFGVEP